MPLSSSVPCALRQQRTILVDADAHANGMRDLNARIADVNVRTGAAALLEVHSRLLFHSVRTCVQRLLLIAYRLACAGSQFSFNRSQFNRITHQYLKKGSQHENP